MLTLFLPKTKPKVVFHVIRQDLTRAVLEEYPYATPTFEIKRFPAGKETRWRVTIDYEIGFTENMTQRSDVLSYMVLAPQHVRTHDVTGVQDSVTLLLKKWAEMFPQGVPDVIF